MSGPLLAAGAAPADLLAHSGHSGGGSVLPGVLLLLLLAAAALLVATVERPRGSQGPTRVEP